MEWKKLLLDWRVHLALIATFAVVIRSIPAWLYSGWGNDFGIYYSVTIEFLARRNPFIEYAVPWGSSGYGSFPMLYMIILVASFITGASPEVLLLRIPPIIGGLTVVPLYFISYELTRKRGLSLMAALLLAINPVHVYQTSMPYFLTIGHFFMLLSLYFFIRWQKDDRFIYFLIPSVAALLLSHHLTNYIFIISITGISLILTVYRRVPLKKVRQNYLFIALYSGVTFAYWVGRVPGMIDFLEAPFRHVIPWYGVIAGYYLLLGVVFYLSLRFDFTRRPIPRPRINVKMGYVFSLFLGVGMVFLVLLAVVGLHGYYIPIISIFYSVPFMLTIGFMGVGLTRMSKYPRLLLYGAGWMIPIALSAIIGLITWSSIEPWRHVEYLMEPLSIVGALGISEILRSDAFKKVSVKKRIKVTLKSPIMAMGGYIYHDSHLGLPVLIRLGDGDPEHEPFEYKTVLQVGRNIQIAVMAIVVFIILMTGVVAFPLMSDVAPPHQEISHVVMSGVQWLVKNGDRNYTVATDHKIGTILAAYHFNSSFEYDYRIWNATSWRGCLDELLGLNGTYPPIGYVLITRDMKEYGVYGYRNLAEPVGPPVYMSNASYDKFHREPFELVFNNSSANGGDWVEIYRVNWTYIHDALNETQSRAIEVHDFKSVYRPELQVWAGVADGRKTV